MDDAAIGGTTTVPNDLEAFWMPFTANRQFKKAPRLFVAAEGMHYTTHDGRQVLDGNGRSVGASMPGMGDVGSSTPSENRRPSSTMRRRSRWGHPRAFEFASRLADLAPADLDHVFFTNSGSESCDTALKIALAFHRVRGEGHRQRLIGRERGIPRCRVRRHLGRRDHQQPQVLRRLAQRRRPSEAHPRPDAHGVQPGPARFGGSNSPMNWSVWSPCMTRRPLPPSSSSRSQGRPACWCRRRAIWSGFGPSATATGFC